MEGKTNYNVELIKKETQDINWKNLESISDFYEKYLGFFKNIDNAIDDESKLFFIKIKLHYIDALISKHRFTISIPILTDVNILLEKLKKHQEYNKLYEDYLMIFGIVEGKLERYASSLEIFKELRKIDPDNDLYKKWYIYNKSNLNSRYNQILAYVGLALILIEFARRIIFDYPVNKYLTSAGLLMCLTSFVIPFVIKYYTKIKEKI